MKRLANDTYFIHDVSHTSLYVYNSEMETRLNQVLNKTLHSIDRARDGYINKTRIVYHAKL